MLYRSRSVFCLSALSIDLTQGKTLPVCCRTWRGRLDRHSTVLSSFNSS